MKNQKYEIDDFTDINELDFGGSTEKEVIHNINFVN